jgi:hypothetical protein
METAIRRSNGGLTQILCRFDISTLFPSNSMGGRHGAHVDGIKAWDSSLRLPGLIVESRTVTDGIIEMSDRLAAVGTNYPDCAMPSTFLHSRYDRTLSDLPVSGSTVRLLLSV